jgi:hypothetical protein
MRRYFWSYRSDDDGNTYIVEPLTGLVFLNNFSTKADELPRDVIEAIKAAKFIVRIDGKPLN